MAEVFLSSGVDVYRNVDDSHYLIMHYREAPDGRGLVGYGLPDRLTQEEMRMSGLEVVLRGIEDELRQMEFDPAEVDRKSDEEAEAFESAYLAVSVRRDAPALLNLTPLRRVTASARVSDDGTDISFALPGDASSFFDALTRAFEGAS